LAILGKRQLSSLLITADYCPILIPVLKPMPILFFFSSSTLFYFIAAIPGFLTAAPCLRLTLYPYLGSMFYLNPIG
jgi:hypothetical protein